MPKKWVLGFVLWQSVLCFGSTWIASKEYRYEWEDPPVGEETRIPWLESKPRPTLVEPNPELKKAILNYFKFTKKMAVRSAIVGPPRVTATAEPKFYVWIVVKDAKGKLVHEGAGRLALHDTQGDGHSVELLNFIEKKSLSDEKSRRKMFPLDADIMIRKFLQ